MAILAAANTTQIISIFFKVDPVTDSRHLRICFSALNTGMITDINGQTEDPFIMIHNSSSFTFALYCCCRDGFSKKMSAPPRRTKIRSYNTLCFIAPYCHPIFAAINPKYSLTAIEEWYRHSALGVNANAFSLVFLLVL